MRAFLIEENNDGVFGTVTETNTDGAGEVLIEVEWSALNYKDWMVAQPKSRVRRGSRLVVGVEAAGRVVESTDDRIAVGDEVMAYGGPIGVSQNGGFAEQLRAPARYVTVLPSSFVFHCRQAMIYGLAGYTAMASVLALEAHGVVPGDGDVLVTGATGGVGSLAVSLLSRRGHRVVASTGSAQHTEWLQQLGAHSVIGRDEIADRADRVLASERWTAAVDCVGGTTLAHILRSLRYGGAVAASGLVASAELATTVYPFITRNVALLGVDAVETSSTLRDTVWRAIADTAADGDETLVEREIGLEGVSEALDAVGRGATRGRWLVRPSIE